MAVWRRRWILLLTALLPAVLGGCMLSASPEDLYALPQLPEEYESLSAQLSEVLSAGAEYAAPQAGGNLPPVQMKDLDGDGVDEVLAFFRINSEDRPLKIYIFRAQGDDYVQAALIDGAGTSFHSVRYEDMDGDGIQEIIVSWRVSAEVQALSVYSVKNLEPVQLMTSSYARYEVVDLDGDDDLELVVLRSDDTGTGLSLADYYDWDSGKSALQLQSTARLSASVATIRWMQAGSLQEGERAVFITARDAGADETSRAITDILACRQSQLTNIVLSSDTGVSTQIARAMNLQPADIDADEATEVPVPAALPADAEGELYWKIYWYGYTAGGESQLRSLTYHNAADGWYLILPDGWDGHFAVRQSNASSAVHATTFYSARGRTAEEELFTVYTFTGTDREAQAARAGRTILRRRTGPDAVYAIAYAENYDQWSYAVPHETLSAGFNTIITRWSMGEN